MVEKNIVFIEEAIRRTKEHSISWDYLDKNKEICKGMEWVKPESNLLTLFSPKECERLDFDVDNSFYAKVDNTYIVLRVKWNSLADLFVIPYTFKKVLKLSSEEYGEYVTRLLNLVQSQFPNAEDFINKFIGE